MRIAGDWFLGEDGVAVPVVAGRFTVAGVTIEERFLVDTGADRTVLTVGLLARLGVTTAGSAVMPLAGVGGDQRAVVVRGAIELRRDDGTWVKFNGDYTGLTDPSAFNVSVLGRDVLNLFDVIVSRRRNEVVLLAGPHAYRIDPSV